MTRYLAAVLPCITLLPFAGRAQLAPEPCGHLIPSAREASALWSGSARGSAASPAGVRDCGAQSGSALPARNGHGSTTFAPSAFSRVTPGRSRDATLLVVPRAAMSIRHPWWAPLASAAIPGAGQATLRQDRFVAYAAVEGFLWLRYAADRRAGLRARDAYRGVARQVSRAQFGGPKPTGNFEYYERMKHWIASGAYDVDVGNPTLDPETDTTTFNGAIWLLARRTYWTAPDVPPPAGSAAYENAVRFYERSAVRPDFQWSWRGATYEQDVFRRHIRVSNEAFRQAIQDIGVVIANHALSTVDAYISMKIRLRAQVTPGAVPEIGLGATLPWAPFGGP